MVRVYKWDSSQFYQCYNGIDFSMSDYGMEQVILLEGILIDIDQ